MNDSNEARLQAKIEAERQEIQRLTEETTSSRRMLEDAQHRLAHYSRALDKIQQKRTRTYWLRKHGWTIGYALRKGTEEVVLRRLHCGNPVQDFTLSLEEARRHYANLLQDGFQKLEGNL